MLLAEWPAARLGEKESPLRSPYYPCSSDPLSTPPARIVGAFFMVPVGTSVVRRTWPSSEGGILHRDRGSHSCLHGWGLCFFALASSRVAHSSGPACRDGVSARA